MTAVRLPRPPWLLPPRCPRAAAARAKCSLLAYSTIKAPAAHCRHVSPPRTACHWDWLPQASWRQLTQNGRMAKSGQPHPINSRWHPCLLTCTVQLCRCSLHGVVGCSANCTPAEAVSSLHYVVRRKRLFEALRARLLLCLAGRARLPVRPAESTPHIVRVR